MEVGHPRDQAHDRLSYQVRLHRQTCSIVWLTLSYIINRNTPKAIHVSKRRPMIGCVTGSVMMCSTTGAWVCCRMDLTSGTTARTWSLPTTIMPTCAVRQAGMAASGASGSSPARNLHRTDGIANNDRTSDEINYTLHLGADEPPALKFCLQLALVLVCRRNRRRPQHCLAMGDADNSSKRQTIQEHEGCNHGRRCEAEQQAWRADAHRKMHALEVHFGSGLPTSDAPHGLVLDSSMHGHRSVSVTLSR